jgi:hypothetical protein
MSIEADPKYRTARLLSYRDQQAEDMCVVMDGGAFLADELARAAEASLADLEAGSALYTTVKTQAVGLRGIAAHFRREVENVRRSWAIKQSEERS